MKDLTVIFLTLNKLPQKWVEYQRGILEEAIGDTPLITISREPMNWGFNLIQTEEPSVQNIYRQVLRGAKEADTPFIAIAEDDCLYHETHFMHRPDGNYFAYNAHRWGLFTWGKPTFYHKPRISNSTMIAHRDLVIKALEERFKLYPKHSIGELGKGGGTRLTYRETKMFYSYISVIYLSHAWALDRLEVTRKKRMSAVRAFDILHWGRAEDIVKKFI